jgi:plasmid maintenance system antidote protein VapI
MILGRLFGKPITYNPGHLLNALIRKLELRNDASLCNALGVAPSIISKIRHRRLPVSAGMLIRMHEVSDFTIQELRMLMGDRRHQFRTARVSWWPKKNSASS